MFRVRVFAGLMLATALGAPAALADELQSIACIEDEVCAGKELTVSGTIEFVDDGVFVVSAGQESYPFRGLGPKSFWKDLGLKAPKKGQTIEVEGVSISCCTESLNVAIAVTFDGQRVQLRDPVTGTPAWKGGVDQESILSSS